MRFIQSVLFISAVMGMGFKTDPDYLLIVGLVTVDGSPVKAAIEVNSIQKHLALDVSTDTLDVSGRFTTRLPAGDEYEIVVKVARFPQQVISLNTLKLDSSQALNVFADFTSPEYDRKLEELISSTRVLSRKSTVFNAKKFARNYGDQKQDRLEYKVQIGAYKFYENFNYNNVFGFPKIIRKTENDHITRFTMGSFETYNEALELLVKLKGTRLKDAFIIGSYKGERKMLQQLVDEKIIN